jgi:hypothetical protein
MRPRAILMIEFILAALMYAALVGFVLLGIAAAGCAMTEPADIKDEELDSYVESKKCPSPWRKPSST